MGRGHGDADAGLAVLIKAAGGEVVVWSGVAGEAHATVVHEDEHVMEQQQVPNSLQQVISRHIGRTTVRRAPCCTRWAQVCADGPGRDGGHAAAGHRLEAQRPHG